VTPSRLETVGLSWRGWGGVGGLSGAGAALGVRRRGPLMEGNGIRRARRRRVGPDDGLGTRSSRGVGGLGRLRRFRSRPGSDPPVIHGDRAPCLPAERLGLVFGLEFFVEEREALLVGRFPRTLLAEVQGIAQPLMEIGTRFRRDALLGKPRVVAPRKVGRNRQQVVALLFALTGHWGVFYEWRSVASLYFSCQI